MQDTLKVGIVGAGIEGASAAFYLAQRHAIAPTLFDDDPFGGATQVAAGMLAPVAEAVFGEESLLDTMLEAAKEWINLAELLSTRFELSCGLRTGGSLLVAVSPNDAKDVERVWRYHQKLGLASGLLRPSALIELEPTLSANVHLGLYSETDNQVDNRVAHRSLLDACASMGTRLVRTRITEISRSQRQWLLADQNGNRYEFDKVIVAAGSRSPEIAGLPDYLSSAMRPIRGQVIRLRTTKQTVAPRLVVRSLWEGRTVYVVPRVTGEIVIGASIEEVGYDPTTRARSTFELLRDSIRVLPQLGEMHVSEINVGFRPGTIDNAPLLGEIDDGLILNTGHFRHGILLAPLTGKWIANEVVAPHNNPSLTAFDPRRFLKSQVSKAGHIAAPDPVAPHSSTSDGRDGN